MEGIETERAHAYLCYIQLQLMSRVFCSDKQADGCVRVPRATGRELSGLLAGGSPEDPAGWLLRQHHHCERCQERTPAAHAGGTQQNCALHEGSVVFQCVEHDCIIVQSDSDNVLFLSALRWSTTWYLVDPVISVSVHITST